MIRHLLPPFLTSLLHVPSYLAPPAILHRASGQLQLAADTLIRGVAATGSGKLVRLLLDGVPVHGSGFSHFHPPGETEHEAEAALGAMAGLAGLKELTISGDRLMGSKYKDLGVCSSPSGQVEAVGVGGTVLSRLWAAF